MAPLIERVRVPIAGKTDVARARRAARSAATRIGFSGDDIEVVCLVVAELGSNLARYASDGWIDIVPLGLPRGFGLQIESRDRGPGIPDLDAALRDGFSTGGGLGGGLPGVRRMMDDFQISSEPAGTILVCRKWLRKA